MTSPSDGEIVYSVSQGDQPQFERCPGLWTVRPDGSKLRAIGPDDTLYPLPSPDGRLLAALLEGESGPDLWILNLRNGKVRRVLKSLDASPYIPPWYTWSPRSDALAVVRRVDGHDEIDRIDARTGATTTLVRAAKQELAYVSWSPDGTDIAYTHFDGGSAAWAVPAGGGNPRKLVDEAVAPVWSHAGTRIAFFRTRFLFEDADLFVAAADGRHPQRLARAFNAGTTAIAWSPDDRSILFVRAARKPVDPFGKSDLYRLDVGSGKETLIAASADVGSWSPRGDRVVFTKPINPSVIGIYTAKPDGSDRRLIAVNDPEDVNVRSLPEWRADAGALVPPGAFAHYTARHCVHALQALQRRLG